MNAHDTKDQKAFSGKGTTREAAVYEELIRGFGDIPQCGLDETALRALDRILDLGEDDIFFCEESCLAYAAHALALESGPKELWVIPAFDKPSAILGGKWKQHAKEMTAKAGEVAKALDDGFQRFKGFASTPPDKPYKLLIVAEYLGDDSGPFSWPNQTSYFMDHLDEVEGSKGAVIYPPLEKQPEVYSLREGNHFVMGIGWAAELQDGRVIVEFDDESETCHMVDLTVPGHPWETEVTPFEVSACGGCLVPSMYRRLAGAIGKTTLGELATRISRGTSLNRKALDPHPYKTVEWTRVFLSSDLAEDSEISEMAHATSRRYGPNAKEDDCLFLDSSCINSDQIEPLFINVIPKGQERYTVVPGDGEVLLISRNEKSFIFYKAKAPTLIANSVYIVWLDPAVDARYLECWLESSYAERWLKTAGDILAYPQDPGPILSKGTLSSLPVPVFDNEVADRTVARKRGIEQKIRELNRQIALQELREAFAPAAAMAENATAPSATG